MKPRLVHIVGDLKLAGAEVQVFSLLPHLRDEFDISVVCLRHRIVEILGDPELARTLGKNGRRRAEAFGIEQVAERTVRVYRELLAAKSSSRAADRAASSG